MFQLQLGHTDHGRSSHDRNDPLGDDGSHPVRGAAGYRNYADAHRHVDDSKSDALTADLAEIYQQLVPRSFRSVAVGDALGDTGVAERSQRVVQA